MLLNIDTCFNFLTSNKKGVNYANIIKDCINNILFLHVTLALIIFLYLINYILHKGCHGWLPLGSALFYCSNIIL